MPQKKTEQVQIESVRVYKYFTERGFTTMGAYTHFDNMQKEGIETIKAADKDLKRLEQILNTSKQYKQLQRKHAGGLIFCEIQFANQVHESRVIIGIGSDFAGIMDLTNKKEYVVREPSDIKWLSDFANRLRNR